MHYYSKSDQNGRTTGERKEHLMKATLTETDLKQEKSLRDFFGLKKSRIEHFWRLPLPRYPQVWFSG